MTETTHTAQEAPTCGGDVLHILELFSDVIVLGVFQYLWQTADDVTLNLHWCY